MGKITQQSKPINANVTTTITSEEEGNTDDAMFCQPNSCPPE
jgi:hypothetical protein